MLKFRGESAVRARGTVGGSARGAVVLRGVHGGVPPVGSEKEGPHQPGAVEVSLHGPTHVPPPRLHWLLCKKAMGCARITRFHLDNRLSQDNEALPACPCFPSLWGSHSVSTPCLTPAPLHEAPWSQQPAHGLASSPVPGSQADPNPGSMRRNEGWTHPGLPRGH